jgi:cytochrome c oxidase subunit 1
MILISGQFVFLLNFVWSLLRGRRASTNPWSATTLEWTVPSPPPHGNFAAPPLVRRWAYEYGLDGDADFASQGA